MTLIRKRVIINTKSDKAFRGVLWSRWLGVWVLKDAEFLRSGGEAIKMDGEVVILKMNIDFVQVIL